MIGDGENTYLWLDPWQQNGILKKEFPQSLLYHSACNIGVKVAALIQNGEWNVPEILNRTAPHVAELIRDTEIEGGQDSVIWSASKSGEFELKLTYEELRKKKAPVWWANLVWHSNNIPRHSFILWMGLSGALKTLNKLK